MPINLSEWSKEIAENEPRRLKNIYSRAVALKHDDLIHTLSKMGNVMSLRKLHRKIAVMYIVLQMEEDELISANDVLKRSLDIVRFRAGMTVDMCGHGLKLIARWGYLEEVVSTKYKDSKQYRRTSLE
mgnify:CR=1 FL=1|tara:strand:+ start:886 stop:1269 length:384 start_codon:yes stop_codon:yes gene_type:complete